MENSESKKGISHFTIVKILKKFSLKEMNEFEKLLKSPFYNNHSTIVKLYLEMKKYYPHFENEKVNKQYLYSVVKKGKYNDKLFIKYLSRLNKLAEEYLNILQLRDEGIRKELNILNQLSKKNIKEVYSKRIRNAETIFSQAGKVSEEDFFLKHLFDQHKYNYNLNDNSMMSQNSVLNSSFENLLNYFLLSSTSIQCQILTQNYTFRNPAEDNALSVFFDNFNIRKFVKALKNKTASKNNTRYLLAEMAMNNVQMSSAANGFTPYTNLKKLLFDNSDLLSKELLSYFLQRLNVFCILESVKGERNMNREIFENYKMLLDHDLFNLNGNAELTLLNFRQILLSALKSNEYIWAENFIIDNLKNVKEDVRTNIHHYSFAHLMFYKNNLNEALTHISKIKSETLPITIDLYILKAKIFFMQGYYDSAFTVSDSFRHFINSNKVISDFHKDNLFNFIKYYNKIIRLKIKNNKSKSVMLLAELKKSLNTKEKKWMTETIEEMM